MMETGRIIELKNGTELPIPLVFYRPKPNKREFRENLYYSFGIFLMMIFLGFIIAQFTFNVWHNWIIAILTFFLNPLSWLFTWLSYKMYQINRKIYDNIDNVILADIPTVILSHEGVQVFSVLQEKVFDCPYNVLDKCSLNYYKGRYTLSFKAKNKSSAHILYLTEMFCILEGIKYPLISIHYFVNFYKKQLLENPNKTMLILDKSDFNNSIEFIT